MVAHAASGSLAGRRRYLVWPCRVAYAPLSSAAAPCHAGAVGLKTPARGLARKLGLGDGPDVWLVPGRLPPMLWSAFGPTRLLLPRDLPDLIDEKQLETLLLHELAHLRRRDHWVRYLEFFAPRNLLVASGRLVRPP